MKIPSEVVEFPYGSLQPKKETGLFGFQSKYPTYDGRGTVIAIFDSGIDPGVPGLLMTSDGKRKCIDRIDVSGSGDVDTRKIVSPDEDGYIKGLSGRKLKVPSWVKNPSGEFRTGIKKAFDLYSRPLKDRILKERQEKHWDLHHKSALAAASRRMEEFDSANSEPLSGLKKLEKENLDSGLETLSCLDKKYKENDRGPIFDCLLYHDGTHWTCIIDNSECGDLEKALKLRTFRETGDYGYLTESDKLNVSINVFDDGDTLQLVGLCASHGTHVASMAAAFFPDNPDKNGTAPGAQIVSLTIGDGRLSSMETGKAVVRALSHVMKAEHYKVDVINMSYGEHSNWSNNGRIGNMIADAVNKHGVLMFVSAGNEGPALCTIGTPPDVVTNTAIGVGAYVSPEMMAALYSFREKLPGTPYTWSSRGPTIDGDRGVCICSPGGAITSVPECTLKCSQLMNGTSMAAPHASGAVSSILSGLKQRSVPYSPFNVKRALAHSAQPILDHCPYAQGNGLLDVQKTFEHLVAYQSSMERDVRFVVTCNSGSKGIHLRDKGAEVSSEISIKIDPIFLDPVNQPAESKINFNVKLLLSCDASWVKCPSHLDLMYTSRHFLLWVDPTGLPPGPHTTYVKAYNVEKIDQGCLFEIPVTVIRTEPLTEYPRFHISRTDVTFKPGQIKRHFVKVPESATWAVFNVRASKDGGTGKFVLHTTQLLPKLSVKTMECNKIITLSQSGEFNHGISVKGGITMEICLAKFWSNLGTVDVTYSMSFFGVSSSVKDIVMHGGEGIYRMEIHGGLHDEEVQPEIKLKNSVQVIRPTESVVRPLKERDFIPEIRTVYELELQYNFNIPKQTEITPSIPLLSNVLYESEFESQLWILYDSNKQFITSGDAYPSRWTTKVDKGDYVLKAQVCHEKKDVLDKMTDLNMLLTQKLSSLVSLDVHTSNASASTGGKKSNSFTLYAHKKIPLYIPPLSTDKYFKNLTGLGQYLSGTMTISKDEYGKKNDIYSFKYILPEGPKKDKKVGDGKKSKDESNKSDQEKIEVESEDKKTKSEKGGTAEVEGNNNANKKIVEGFKESLRDLKVGWLSRLDWSSEEHKQLYDELRKSETDGLSSLQVHFAHLQALDAEKAKRNLDEIISTVDLILQIVKPEEILVHMAAKHDYRSDASEQRKTIEKKKTIYLEALVLKGSALCDKGMIDEATEVLFQITRIVDVTDSRVISFVAQHAGKLKHFGKALKLYLKQYDDKPTQEIDAKLLEMFKALSWEHCYRHYSLSKPIRFPSDYELF